MKSRTWIGFGRWRLAALTALAATLFSGGAFAQDQMHARVSYDSGGATIKGTADADWSYATVNTLVMPGDTLWIDQQGTLELEMSGGTFLRMADGSKIDVVSLPPSAALKGWTGSFYIQRVSRSNGNVVFQTPVADTVVERDTQVRFDILSNGATTVSVRWGAVTLKAPGAQDVVLRTGQRSYIDPGYLPSAPETFDRGQEDSFDAWNRERARLLAVGADAVPTTVIKEAPIGVSDLGAYGEWVAIESEYYWRPTVVTNYVPYRNGHWSFVPAYGYTWVDDYPFAYVTSHYGRWRHHPTYGWCWGWRPVWGPAWVATVRVGSNFLWTPLDPWDRPIVYGSDYYTVGGLRFSVYASSYVPMDYVLYGPRYISPFTPSIVYGVPNTQINIWNINIHSDRPHFPRPDRSIPVRDYSPRRVIRGPMSLNQDGVVARARVANLENMAGRQRFSPVDVGQRRNVRTPEQSDRRAAQARSVRLAPEATSPTPDVRGRRLATSDISGIRDSGAGGRTRVPSDARTGRGAPGSSAPTDRAAPQGGRGRATGETPSVRERGAERPEGAPSAPSERGRVRSVETPDRPTVPDARPRSATPSPGGRERGVDVERGGGATRDDAGRSIRQAPTSAPSTGRERRVESPTPRSADVPRQTTPSPRTRSMEQPSAPRSIEPARPQTPSRRSESIRGPQSVTPRAIEAPAPRVESPRVVETPRAPQIRTAPQVRQAPQVAPAPRQMAPAPRQMAPAPRQVTPAPRQMAPAPRMSQPQTRQSPQSFGGSMRGSGGVRGGGGGAGGGSVRGRAR